MHDLRQLDTQGQPRDGEGWIRRVLEVSAVALLPADQDMQQVRGSACGRDCRACGLAGPAQPKE